MNPAEVYQFLVAMLRSAPEVLAGACVALGLGLVAGWKGRDWLGIDRRKQEELEKELVLEKARAAGRIAQLEKDRDDEKKKRQAVEVANDKLEAVCQKLREAGQELEGKIGEYEHLLGKYKDWKSRASKRIQRLKAHIQNIRAQGGKIWERPVAADAPAFVSLAGERKCPIISLLNLKGGVGKTTLTVNLAATLADMGKRVLMIDCDHQRSLTSLCIRTSVRQDLHAARHTLQHFLLGPDRSAATFRSCIRGLQNMGSCSLVANTAAIGEGSASGEAEGLARAEEQLLLHWVAASGNSVDIRLILRSALHHKEVRDHFDYVLIDCPPRLGTATINALAASDYLLLPVVLDDLSATTPLPHLLRELRRLHSQVLFPQFKILGIVANRVHMPGGKVGAHEKKVWDEWPVPVKAAWGEPVHRFKTMIQQLVAFGKAAQTPVLDMDHPVAVWRNDTVKAMFSKLTQEILKRIANEAPHSAAIS